MNESMLTGESIPIVKSPIPNNKELFSFKTSKNHILFEGTKVMQNKNETLIVAVRTGFTSFKGQLIRTVLFPKIINNKSFKDIAKFIIFFLILCLILFFASLNKMIQNNVNTKIILIHFGDYIVSAIPPSLLLYFIHNEMASLNFLKKMKIFGTTGDKIFESGKVKTICFDKTGTLTKLELDIVGIHDSQEFQKLKIADESNENYSSEIYKIMANCHGAILINGEIKGEFLEIEMIKYSKWTLENSDDDSLIKFEIKYINL